MSAILYLLLSLHLTFGIDYQFRFANGQCLKGKRPGYNPDFWGECGNLAQTLLVANSKRNFNYKGSNFNNSQFFRSTFKNGDFSNTFFSRSTWVEVEVFDSKLQRIYFVGSMLKSVTFSNSDLSEVVAQGSRLIKVQFLNCNLKNANFWGADLQEANFENSNLEAADLRNTNFLFTKFVGAKFDSKTRLPFSEQEALSKGMIKID